MNSVIVGASAGLGRALAEELAGRGHALVLAATDGRDLDAIAQDLRLRFGVMVRVVVVDLAAFDAEGFRDEVLGRGGAVDALFLVAGSGDDADCGPVPGDLARRLLQINLSAPLLIANAFLEHLGRRGQAHLVGIGSVAAMRGRGRNMIYGAAKRGLEFYFEALRLRLSATGCRVQFYRAGFMATSMLQGRGGLLVARPQAVARRIADRLEHGPEGLAYAPAFWGLISLVLGLLPFALFRRLRI